MTDAADPTEPTTTVSEPAEGEAHVASPAAGAAAAPDAGARGGTRGVSVPWWLLAVGAVACLLLGSALTFVGTKANDDGPGGMRVSRAAFLQQRGEDGGRGFPGGGPQFGPGGPDFQGPGGQGGPGG